MKNRYTISFLIIALVCAAICIVLAVFSSRQDSDAVKTENGTGNESSETNINITDGLKTAEDEEKGTRTIETDYFILTLSNFSTWDYRVDANNRITIYNTRARDKGLGGRVMSIETWKDLGEEPYGGAVPYKEIGIRDGQMIIVTYASDIQYDYKVESETEEYMAIRNEAETIQEGGASGPLILKNEKTH